MTKVLSAAVREKFNPRHNKESRALNASGAKLVWKVESGGRANGGCAFERKAPGNLNRKLSWR
jgi:hypothetical protein